MTPESRLDYLKDVLQLPSLVFDEEGCCIVTFDDIPINFQTIEDRLVMTIYIAELPENTEANFFAKLLAANLYWKATQGCTLAFDSESRSLVAQVVDDENKDIKQVLESLLKVTEGWRTYMDNPPIPHKRQDIRGIRL
ncbi:type III secretion system chaperone [Candidatus Regiella endosymbiont of Tuberolachnus salignus]|uniref:type III secretion system chaperone n=1 Tax=Candidatus Regiella endosymbiont of Tuberolachnus salignus TaxID=3077956 RepID=UPI0030CA847E